jgi:hypothetical protein
MTQFVKGEVAHLTLEATNLSGGYVDPATLVLNVLPPDRIPIALSPTRDALGKFSADLSLDQVGAYGYQWIGTGANQGVGEGSFYVHDRQFAA